MHKGKFLTAVLIILISLAGYYTYLQNRVLGSKDFIIKDSKEITEIRIEQGSKIVTLKKNEHHWIVDNAFPANQNLIKRFFKVFANLNLIAPVSAKKQDSIKQILNQEALKITLFRNNHLAYEYLIASLNSRQTGNYVLCNDNLALVNALGLYKDLKSIVSANSLFWRNKIIFNKQATQIKTIKFQNYSMPEKSFMIKNEDHNIELYDYQNRPIKNYDTVALSRYLSYFQNISFKRVENELSDNQLDSLFVKNKAYTIELMDKNNNSYQLDLYFKPQKWENQMMSKKNDLNLIYGILNDEKNLFIFEYYDIDPVLKDLDWFL